METKIVKVLDTLKADDIRIDISGRVVIVNPKINDMIKDLGLKLPIEESAIDNVACCQNGYQCGCSGATMDFSDRLAGKRYQ